jgi:hypothetical protein
MSASAARFLEVSRSLAMRSPAMLRSAGQDPHQALQLGLDNLLESRPPWPANLHSDPGSSQPLSHALPCQNAKVLHTHLGTVAPQQILTIKS